MPVLVQVRASIRLTTTRTRTCTRTVPGTCTRFVITGDSEQNFNILFANMVHHWYIARATVYLPYSCPPVTALTCRVIQGSICRAVTMQWFLRWLFLYFLYSTFPLSQALYKYANTESHLHGAGSLALHRHHQTCYKYQQRPP